MVREGMGETLGCLVCMTRPLAPAADLPFAPHLAERSERPLQKREKWEGGLHAERGVLGHVQRRALHLPPLHGKPLLSIHSGKPLLSIHSGKPLLSIHSGPASSTCIGPPMGPARFEMQLGAQARCWSHQAVVDPPSGAIGRFLDPSHGSTSRSFLDPVEPRNEMGPARPVFWLHLSLYTSYHGF